MEGRCDGCEEFDCRPNLERLIADQAVQIATSELSIAEFHSNLCGILNDQSRKQCDEACSIGRYER